MDPITVGAQIARLRKARGLTQAALGERLSISFQAVSKWERGETLPDTALLLNLAQVLATSVDNLLLGGERAVSYRGIVSAKDMKDGVDCLVRMGRLLGRDNILYRYAIEGLSEKMNSDVQAMLDDDSLRECLAAEAAISAMRQGYYLDLTDIRRSFAHDRWVEVLTDYAARYGMG